MAEVEELVERMNKFLFQTLPPFCGEEHRKMLLAQPRLTDKASADALVELFYNTVNANLYRDMLRQDAQYDAGDPNPPPVLIGIPENMTIHIEYALSCFSSVFWGQIRGFSGGENLKKKIETSLDLAESRAASNG